MGFCVRDAVDEQQAILECQAVPGQSDDALDLPTGAVLTRRVYDDHATSAEGAARRRDEQQVTVIERRLHARATDDEK